MSSKKLEDGSVELDISNGVVRVRDDEAGEVEEVDFEKNNCVLKQKGQKPASKIVVDCGGEDFHSTSNELEV